jgi:hypothetical protein
MKKLVSLTSRALTFGIAVLSMPTLALAQATLVELQSPGELTGAGVVVPVTVACVDDSTGADVEVKLLQPVGNGTAFGEGDLDLDNGPEACGSTPQTVHVLVRPDPRFEGPFDANEANAGATLDACDSSGSNCNSLTDEQVINIVD